MTSVTLMSEHFAPSIELEEATRILEDYTNDSNVSKRIYESLQMMNFPEDVSITQFKGCSLRHIAYILSDWSIGEKIVLTVQVRNRKKLNLSQLSEMVTFMASQHPETKTTWIITTTPNIERPIQVSLFRDMSLTKA